MDCRPNILTVVLLGATLLPSVTASAQDALRLPDRTIPPAPTAAISDSPVHGRSATAGSARVDASANVNAASPQKPSDARPSLAYEPNWPEPPNLSSVLIRLMMGTVFTIGLCGGTLWFGRRWLQKNNVLPGGTSNREMTLVESTRLGGHCVVHLLQIGDQRVLVGTDRTGLQSIVPMPESFSGVLDDQSAVDDSDDSTESASPLRAFSADSPSTHPRIIRSGLSSPTSSNSIEQV